MKNKKNTKIIIVALLIVSLLTSFTAFAVSSGNENVDVETNEAAERSSEIVDEPKKLNIENKKIIYPDDLDPECSGWEGERGTYEGMSASFKKQLERFNVADDDIVAFEVGILSFDCLVNIWENCEDPAAILVPASDHLENIRLTCIEICRDVAKKYDFFKNSDFDIEYFNLVDGIPDLLTEDQIAIRNAIIDEAKKIAKADEELKKEFDLYLNDRLTDEVVDYFNKIRGFFIDAGFEPMIDDITNIYIDQQHVDQILVFYGTKKQLLDWDASLIKETGYLYFPYVRMISDCSEAVEGKPFYEDLESLIDGYQLNQIF